MLKTVYLGNWIANAQHEGSDIEPHMEEYENIATYMFSLAGQFGLEEWIGDAILSREEFFPTDVFIEGTDVHELIEEYDDRNFWEELPTKLGLQDFHRNYSEEEIRKMTSEERFKKVYDFTDKWREETIKHGVGRLKIDN